MTTKRQFDYKIGDRVAERPKPHGIYTNNQQIRERISQYRSQRYGEVVGINYKNNSRGTAQKFLLVRWDHLPSPTEHATARICPVSALERLTKEVLVPGE
jgi:hypothetical protein